MRGGDGGATCGAHLALATETWTGLHTAAPGRTASSLGYDSCCSGGGAVVKVGNYSRRAEREQKKLELFREIGRLIRSGLLRRVRRNLMILGGRDALPPAPRALSPAHWDEPLPLPRL